jgi:hypothetical protein
MFSRFIKILTFLFLFIITTGFIPIFSLIGPGVTVLSSGNIYKASAQYLFNHSVKKKTGKNSLEYLRDEIKINNKEVKIKTQNKEIDIDINEELKKLVERRILETRAKLDLTKFNQ